MGLRIFLKRIVLTAKYGNDKRSEGFFPFNTKPKRRKLMATAKKAPAKKKTAAKKTVKKAVKKSGCCR